MAENITKEKKIEVSYESRNLRIHRESNSITFTHVEHGEFEGGCNDSFCITIKNKVFRRAIIELFKTGRCVLSEDPKFEIEKHGEHFDIIYSISDYHKVCLSIKISDFDRVVS